MRQWRGRNQEEERWCFLGCWGGRALWRPEKQAVNKQIEAEREISTEGWRQTQHELEGGNGQTERGKTERERKIKAQGGNKSTETEDTCKTKREFANGPLIVDVFVKWLYEVKKRERQTSRGSREENRLAKRRRCHRETDKDTRQSQ